MRLSKRLCKASRFSTRLRGLGQPGMILAFALSGILYCPGEPLPASLKGRSEGVAASKWVGDAGCLPCHEAYSTPYRHTAHHLTSQLAGPESILGSFTGGGSTLTVLEPVPGKSIPGLRFQMDIRAGGYYQTAIAGMPGHEQSHSARIDVVTGSGARGQSYLYWLGDQLFELPLSYWSDGHKWINSPGFKDRTANFSREVYPRCLECHATDIESRSQDPLANHYDQASLVVGISCETCHGHAAKHVAARESGKRTAGTAQLSSADGTILNPARFARDRQVDLCALCHSGAQQKELEPAFSYIPGEPLDSYLQPTAQDSTMQPEVHGNQVGLLKRSRCYLSSPTMSCSTCHDVHAPEKPAASYSTRCLSCHKVESCNMSKTLGPKIADSCIDCHMPEQPTRAIVATTAGNVVRAAMRSHWIRIYPDVNQP